MKDNFLKEILEANQGIISFQQKWYYALEIISFFELLCCLSSSYALFSEPALRIFRKFWILLGLCIWIKMIKSIFGITFKDDFDPDMGISTPIGKDHGCIFYKSTLKEFCKILQDDETF